MMSTALAVGVVLPAAGLGQRVNSCVEKQYHIILGRPLYTYTVDHFLALDYVRSICLVVAVDRVASVQEELTHFFPSAKAQRVVVVAGGATRHRSIAAGVKHFLDEQHAIHLDVVVVHDVARVFFDSKLLLELIGKTASSGAAGVCRPLVSTVLKVNDQQDLSIAFPRNELVASEMPQVFRLDVAQKMYASCTEFDLDHGTECLALAQQYGAVTPTLLTGSDVHWKVTVYRDVLSIEGLITGQNLLHHFKIFGDMPHDYVTAISKLTPCVSGLHEWQTHLNQTYATFVFWQPTKHTVDQLITYFREWALSWLGAVLLLLVPTCPDMASQQDLQQLQASARQSGTYCAMVVLSSEIPVKELPSRVLVCYH